MPAVLKHIAAIAKGLNKAELHVLIELAARAEVRGSHEAVASSRELAAHTGLARASVQAAIDSLNTSGVIKSDSGGATRAAQHQLSFLAAVEIEEGRPTIRPGVAQELGHCGRNSEPVLAQKLGQGGPTARPEVAQVLTCRGLRTEPGVAQNLGQSGLNSGPLPNGKPSTCEPAHIENASAPAESIEKNDFDNLIDRLQKAKKSDFNDEVFEQARNLIASHHAKFAHGGCQMPGLPDDQITAQFLAVADWPRLNRTLHDLMSERKQSSHSWGWYVTVALQRIHGISPDTVRGMREKLKKTARSHVPGARLTNSLVRIPSSPDSYSPRMHDQVPTNVGLHSFEDQIRALAASKSIR
ncbi:MAG: hypothetical protein ACJ746_25145 [Bryobacteraceae bacterium]